MINKINRRHIALLSLLALIAAAGLFIWRDDQLSRTSAIIRPFNADKDLAILSKLINANKFLLSERPDFPTEKFLLWRAPELNPARKGQARIDVIEAEGVPAGFISFYRQSATAGFIWLLAVDERYRGRGMGEDLMLHALRELKRQGATHVTLSTRTFNKAALKLYYKLGFVEQSRSESRGIINLIKRSL
jgi:ribosomal protein S18 acetylase RimI-like enzyme